MIEVDPLLPAPLVGPPTAVYASGRCGLVMQDLGGTAVGKPRAEASTRRAVSVGTEAANTEACRSDSVGLVAACLDGLEIRLADRKARDGHRLASQGFSSLLALENPMRKARAPPPCCTRFVI
jgi:hypothetical protein